MERYYSHGKLLLTGEYVVLDGAKALALPTKFGQHLKVQKTTESSIKWLSIDHRGNNWFEGAFEFSNDQFVCSYSNIHEVGDRLARIFNSAYQLDKNILSKVLGTEVTTALEFLKDWGLDTSSTLINNMASWLGLDPYSLLAMTFGGSGYDIACANAESAIAFQIKNNTPHVIPITFDPSFKSDLYFVYLNEKQDSREGISHYRNTSSDLTVIISKINAITEAMIKCSDLETFKGLIDDHEVLISECIQTDTVKNRLFSDFNGSIKSLGAWGGDFILVASNADPRSYFKSKGYTTILSYDDIILN